MSDNTKSISCPNCGSTDVKIGQKGIIECQSCNGKFFVNADENLINAIHKIERMKRDPETVFASGIKYEDSITEDDYVNKILLYLKDEYLAPGYIFDELICEDVKRIEIPIVCATGHSEINYSRMIGTDKIETWTEVKTTKYSDGTSKKNYYNRSKTVTDWDPDSGMLVGEAVESAYDDKYKQFDDVITLENRENNTTILSDSELDSYEINPEMINDLKNRITNTVFYKNITYPGDHVKNETFSGTTKITELSCVILPIYVLNIKVRDELITFYACSNGQVDIKQVGHFPMQDDQEEANNAVYEIAKERNKVAFKPKTFMYLSYFLGIAFFLLFIILGSNFDIVALNIISFIVLLSGIVVGLIFSRKVKKITREYGTKINEYNNIRDARLQKQKDEGYERYIKNR